MTTTTVRHRAAADAPPDAAGGSAHDDERVPVRVWQIPVRVIHWLLVATIVVLTVTGLFIGTPVLGVFRTEPVVAYTLAIHIVTGFVFIALLIARLIFAFSGNRYARWDQFLPFKRAQRAQILPSLKFYLFLTKEPPAVVGHNPLAGMTYTVLFLMLTVEALTGLALDSLDSRSGWMWFVSGWIFSLFSIGTVRLIHHLIMWLIWGFAIHHVYSAILMDHVERSGVVSSIISGWKNIPKDRS